MNRVPSSSAPKPGQPARPASGPKPLAQPAKPQASAGPAGAGRFRRPGGPKHVEKEKPQKLKTGAEESEGTGATTEAKPSEGGEGARSAHEHAKLAEAWVPESHAEKAEKKEAKDELHEEEAKGSEGAPGEKSLKGFLKQIKPALKAPNAPVEQKKARDGFEKQNLAGLKTAQAQQAAQAKASAPVTAAAPVGAPPPAGQAARPPDAFAVLHAAQDKGVYFKEEGHNGAAEQADPELSAAIEEAIRLLFGVRGILRVTGGFNQEQQPAIIVVATQGFGEASMKLVPPKVHRFETILAVPYDMLPLKRERLL